MRDDSRMSHAAGLRRDIRRHLRLGSDLCKEFDRLAAAANEALAAGPYVLNLRDKVMVGLIVKINHTYRALLVDVRDGRGEAMHHLKTMVESFIYFYVVAKDISDKTAKRLLVEATKRKIKHLDDNPEYETADVSAGFQAMAEKFAQEGIRRLGSDLKSLAEANSPELEKWYRDVYGSACEPAHISDLFEFLPTQKLIATDRPSTHIYRVALAALRASSMACGLLEFISADNVLGLTSDVARWKRRRSAIS